MTESRGRDTALAYLRTLQASVASPHQESIQDRPPEAREQFARIWFSQYGGTHEGQSVEEFLELFREAEREAQESRATRFEAIGWHYIITDLVSRIERTLPRLSPIFEFPPEHYLFATLPTGRINGMALRVPESAFSLILIEDGLFPFCNLMCQAIASALNLSWDPRVEAPSVAAPSFDDITAASASTKRFLAALEIYVVGGNSSLPLLPSGAYGKLSTLMLERMETFVLCHEFGHLVSGHLSDASYVSAVIGESQVTHVVSDWAKEAEADSTGLKIDLAVTADSGLPLPFGFLGADLFFGCVEVIERAIQTLFYGCCCNEGLPTETHPSASTRREGVRYIISTLRADQSAGILPFLDLVASIVDRLWEVCEPTLRAMHRDGVRPAPLWHPLIEQADAWRRCNDGQA